MERFWKKVSIGREDDCWEWQAGKLSTYGGFRLEGRMHLAHRVAWMLTHGEMPPPEVKVMHSCDNMLCCNPRHLSLGTQLQNIADMVVKGRQRSGGYASKGEEHPRHVLTDEQVIEIRELYAAGRIMRELAIEYAVSYATIQGIIIGKYWRHIGGPLGARPKGTRAFVV